MRIRFTFKALVAGRSANTGKDGKMYYNLALVVDGQAGNVSCPKEVYDAVVLMKENMFRANYSFQWNRLTIESLAV